MSTILDDYNVTIVTPSTVDNFDDYCSYVDKSHALYIANVTMSGILALSLKEGWNPSTQKLGDYCRRTTPFNTGDRETFELLNKFGDAYATSGRFPVILLTNKETGKLFTIPEDELKEGLSMFFGL